MANGMSEYVVKLSAQIDNPGLSQLLSLLDVTKLKAAAVTTVFAAATTAVYKFISSAAKKEIELKALADQQKKNIDNLKAQQEALAAMGKTIKEVNKSKELKEIYKDIRNFNKEFASMDISGTIQKINGLRGAFWKLKSAVSYTIQEIGKRVLVNLEGPITRITGNLNKFSNWIRDHFVSLTSKIASFVTAFAKGLLVIAETVEKVAKFFNSLPDSIKGIASAMAAIVAILKSGPLGALFAAIELIGAMKDDYSNYLWNKENADTSDPNKDGTVYVNKDFDPTKKESKKNSKFTKDVTKAAIGADGKPEVYQVPLALEPIWEIKDDESLTASEKASKIGEKVVSYFNEMISSIPAEELGTQFGTMINNVFTKLLSVLSGDTSGTMGQAFETIKTAVQKIFEFIATAFGTIDLNSVLESVNLIIGKVMGLLTEALNTGLDVVFGEHGAGEKEEKGMLDYAVDFLKSIVDSIGKAAETVKLSDIAEGIGNFISNLFTKIGEWLGSSTNGAAQLPGDILSAAISLANGVMDAILAGLNALFTKNPETGKTGIETFVTGLFDFLKNALNDLSTKISGGDEGFDLETSLSGLGEKIGSAIGSLITIGTNFLATFVDNALQWVVDNADKLADIGFKILSAILQGLGNIWDAIMKKLFGEDWVGTGERRETVDTVAGQFTDENGEPVDTITDIYGNESTREEAQNYASTDTKAAQVRYGLREANEFEAYKRGFYGQLGADQLSMNLGASSDFFNDITKLLNLDYDSISGTIWGEKGGKRIDAYQSTALLSAITDLNFADSIESFKSAFDQINAKLAELGLGQLNTEDADKEGMKDASKALADLSSSSETASNDMRTAGTLLRQAGTTGVASMNMLQQSVAALNLSVDGEEAYGGRIGSEGIYRVAEDGPEYIIPITKSERAFNLINQMLHEMGTSAINRVMNGFGIGMSGTIGSNIGSLGAAMNGLVMNNTYNISAPVNINVSASGASAEDIGTQAYNLAERHLVRTLMGVYA